MLAPHAHILVLTGDPSLPDVTKPGHRYNPEELANIDVLREALAGLAFASSCFAITCGSRSIWSRIRPIWS